MGRKRKEETVTQKDRTLYFLRIKDTVINIYQISKVLKPESEYNDNRRIKVEFLREPSMYFEFSSEAERNREFERAVSELLI